MPFVVLILGAVLLVAAYNNTQGDLGTALQTDVPPYIKWGLALTAVGALQWIPGFRTPARWMLGLVLVTIVLTNYSKFATLASEAKSGSLFATSATGTPATTPAAAITASPTSPNITTGDITGTTSSTTAASVNAANVASTVTSAFGLSDPSMFLAEYEQGLGGFGGVA